MGDWALPVLISGYADFLAYLAARDFDAISLGLNTIVNPVAGMIRYVRASNRFQEFDGTVWQDKILSLAGGGLGSNTAAGGRTSLGLGSIATQDANNVSITGGNLSNIGSLVVNGVVGIGGDLDVNGVITTGALGIPLTDANGKIPGIDSTRFASLSGANLTGLTAGQIPNLDTSQITTGVFNQARLGAGTANSTTFLRGDGSWASALMTAHKATGTAAGNTTSFLTISPSLTDWTKAVVVYLGVFSLGATAEIVSSTQIKIVNQDSSSTPVIAYILQGQ